MTAVGVRGIDNVLFTVGDLDTAGQLPPFHATIEIDRSTETGRIDPNIYGHFLESSFFGNIEGGVFDEGSPLSIDSRDAREGLRKDVLTLCQDLGVPVVRWPGGNFTSPYHWEDGVGPRDARPSRLCSHASRRACPFDVGLPRRVVPRDFRRPARRRPR
jgi:hypothetical protein